MSSHSATAPLPSSSTYLVQREGFLVIMPMGQAVIVCLLGALLCPVARLGMAALGSEKTRSAVLADQRFQSLWRRAVDLLPLAQGPEISLMLK